MEPRQFRSREYAGFQPVLTVIYDCESLDITPEMDSFVSNNSPDMNYGAEARLEVGGPGGSYQRSYLQFDLTGVPENACIDFARLRMYHYEGSGGGGHRMGVHRVTGSWDEGTITWNFKPAHASGAECFKGPVGDCFYTGWMDWDISDLMAQWLSQIHANCGVVIKCPNEVPQGAYRRGRFRSREYEGVEFRPQVQVLYEVPADVTNGPGNSAGPLGLVRCVPNPFHDSTRIVYSIPDKDASTLVRLSIYDAAGRLVRNLVDEFQDAGCHGVAWDCTDHTGQSTGCGLYFCRLAMGDKESTSKMIVR
jgi:hypothetical protein